MPRRKSAVKGKKAKTLGYSTGIVDIHFHGAYGVDLMTASEDDLELPAPGVKLLEATNGH